MHEIERYIYSVLGHDVFNVKDVSPEAIEYMTIDAITSNRCKDTLIVQVSDWQLDLLQEDWYTLTGQDVLYVAVDFSGSNDNRIVLSLHAQNDGFVEPRKALDTVLKLQGLAVRDVVAEYVDDNGTFIGSYTLEVDE